MKYRIAKIKEHSWRISPYETSYYPQYRSFGLWRYFIDSNDTKRNAVNFPDERLAWKFIEADRKNREESVEYIYEPTESVDRS